jgi:hypothetical protein
MLTLALHGLAKFDTIANAEWTGERAEWALLSSFCQGQQAPPDRSAK